MDEIRTDARAIEKTGRLMSQARRVLAYDNFDSILQKPLYYADGAVFPQFVESARGFEFTDTTGRTYVDWVNGGGPVLLGHRRPEVEEAICAQLRAGPNLPLMHPLEVEVATMLTEMIPNAEVVAFGKNGSDGLAGAARLARAITGGDIFLHYGMHGFHDWFVSSNPVVRGVPEVLRPLIHPFQYNDLAGLEKLFKRFRGRVAAVVMEPVREVLPDPGYLEGVRELVHRNDALLIFDEVITALRLGPGGAQTYLGVEPDLACLGKALGNGMPLSALVGLRKFMSQMPATAFGMTFRGETLSLAAARATLRIVRDEPVAEHVAGIGTQVREVFDEACRSHQVRARLGGPPARMTFGFEADAGLSCAMIGNLFVQECVKNGIFTNGNILPSYAHNRQAVERTAGGFNAALAVVGDMLREARGQRRSAPITAVAARRAMVSTGGIETLGIDGGDLVLGGWALLPDSAPDRVVMRLGGQSSAPGTWVDAEAVERPDVAAAHPDRPEARGSGYLARLPLPAARPNPIEVTIHFERLGAIAFICKLVIESELPDSGSWAGPFRTGDGIVHV